MIPHALMRHISLLTMLLLIAMATDAVEPTLEEAILSGDAEAAVAAFERKTQSGPVERRFDAARVELLQGDTTEAIGHLEWLVEVDPDDPDFNLWLSRALFARAIEVNAFRKPFVARRAMNALERAYDLAPYGHDSSIDLILVHLKVPILGGGEDAAREVLAGLDRARSPLRSFARGIVAYETAEWAEAERALTRAAGDLPDPRRALFWLGYLFQRTGRWDAAFGTHERLLALSPNDPRVWYEFGRTAQFSGQRTQLGRRMLERYVKTTLPSGATSKEEAEELLEQLLQ